MYYDAIDLLKGMISRPSFSREEGETADFLKQSWEKAGYKVNRKGNNLWLIAPGFDLDKPTLLLNSHIDTVKPASGWTKDPFNPEETEDERLYGLGSNDAGASVVSLYEAFRVLSGKEQPYNLIFLASCEEEVSGKNGLESALADLPPIAFAVVGEPTGMQPAVAEKGLMVLDCVSTGKAGHAARNEGINAITLAMKDIEWFNTYQFPEKSDFLGPVKMSVTIIHAGTQHNVVPDRCEFTVDIRTNEFYPNEKLFELIKSQVGCEIKSPQLPPQLHPYRFATSVRTPCRHDGKRAFRFAYFERPGPHALPFRENRTGKFRPFPCRRRIYRPDGDTGSNRYVYQAARPIDD